MEKLKNKQTKIIFIVVSILLIMPSIIYMIQNRTLLGFNKYYNFFITDKTLFEIMPITAPVIIPATKSAGT